MNKALNDPQKTQVSDNIEFAVSLLQNGELVAIPTETVYGLAADASNPKAIEKTFKVKGRPSSHPLIVHIGSDQELKNWAIDIPDIAYRLTQAFWPGPLTLILKRAPHVSKVITGGQDTIAIRSPNHPLTQKLLQAFKGGLTAPSANRFGHVSPTEPQHVLDDLNGKIQLILDGGRCKIGVESTILDLTVDPPVILRPGMIGADEMSQVIGQQVQYQHHSETRVPGTLASHYAPKTIAKMISKKDLETNQQFDAVVIAYHAQPKTDRHHHWIELSDDPKIYAYEIYDALRKADTYQTKLILIEELPHACQWDAVRDRLNRATY